jgi:gamma-polyglutamate biosynthesis protein CapA
VCLTAALVAWSFAVSCTSDSSPGVDRGRPDASASVRGSPDTGSVVLLFGGDVMVGRGVQELAGSEPARVFAGLAPVLGPVAFVAANLESPLTSRPPMHADDPNALLADPGWAPVLARAGFDVLSMANNHAGDAGHGGVGDSIRALRDAGIAPIGVGPSAASARVGIVRRFGDVRVGMLAFDASETGSIGTDGRLGVAPWSPVTARRAVVRMQRRADVVTVALHGGTSYSIRPDPNVVAIADRLAEWGVDVVWVSGPHLIQPVRAVDPDGDGKITVVATSLGNLIFDQWFGGMAQGLLMAVRIDRHGVTAWRVGRTTLDGPRVVFLGWGSWSRAAPEAAG